MAAARKRGREPAFDKDLVGNFLILSELKGASGGVLEPNFACNSADPEFLLFLDRIAEAYYAAEVDGLENITLVERAYADKLQAYVTVGLGDCRVSDNAVHLPDSFMTYS